MISTVPKPVWAGSASTTLGVTATVANNCAISTTPLAFGPYDPIITNATSPLDGAGTVTMACTKGATTSVGLNPGSNAPGFGTSRAMSNGTAKLSYEIYQDTGRTQIWGNSAPDLYTPPLAADKSLRSFTVYGRLPSGQDVSAGIYVDTVVATVNF